MVYWMRTLRSLRALAAVLGACSIAMAIRSLLEKVRQGVSRVSGRVDLRFNSICPLPIIMSSSTRASLGIILFLRDVIVHVLMHVLGPEQLRLSGNLA